jgi:cytochrome P450
VGIPSLQFTGQEPYRFGAIGRLLRNPCSFWPDSLMQDSAISATAAGKDLLIVSHPHALKAVLCDADDQVSRSRVHARMMTLTYGDNLVRADHEDWRQQRLSFAPAFRAFAVADLENRVRLAGMRQIEAWQARDSTQPADLIHDMRILALDALWSSFFTDPEGATRQEPLIPKVLEAHRNQRDETLMSQLASLRPLADLAMAQEKGPLFAPGARVDDDQKRYNNMLLFLHAGHDNTAAALAWTLWLLSLHPELQERARAEAHTEEAGAAMPWLTAALREALRLYPPIMHLIRETTDAMEIAGVDVAPRTPVILSLYAMHRHRQFWEEPDAFRPERFISGGPIERFVWSPFGAGPRVCIGQSFAMMEMTRLLALMLARFEMIPNPDAPIEAVINFTMRPFSPAPVYVKPISR